MKVGLPIALAVLVLASPALPQGSDFNLTYHVERTPATKLSLAACGNAVIQIARQSKLSVDSQSFPGQLVMVKGGRAGAGTFVVQCIAVGNMTVSVVQGIDYRTKGALGQFADRAFAAVKAAIK
ncbi:DUF6180 family protein [Sphingomonas psychrotolerans]|uniref:Uncharacterized protein n=1 Tax=Sphingomonas psychrotolerans TaxID=1327635 RepID=A0A2K8MBC0_9SPHN|nr:DUF6180 family protein [Sphingomonas psychrotolerans]ATY31175.1 hypothetical protein CVN68_03580 [Sphingomonas psychrotolerans]